jgi:hypothetical protein
MSKSRHKKISYTKSWIRIAGFLILFVNPVVGCALLIIAEVLGMIEEWEE